MVPGGKDIKVVKNIKLIPGLTVLTLVIMGFAQCNRCPGIRQSPILGLYEVAAHDTSGRLIFTGAISLSSLEQNLVKGRCTIKWEKNAPDNFLDEDGGCEGLIEGKVISIDTAPSMDHAGMLLDGEFNDGRITGTWRIDSFATSPPLGKFEAVKKR
jgi:hypothetical protein